MLFIDVIWVLITRVIINQSTPPLLSWQASLNLVQSRCRSLEGELNRLRQLQGLRAEKVKQREQTERLADIQASAEVAQLQAQCTQMAAHLQRAVQLQEAALAVAEAASGERDAVGNEAERLRAQLAHARKELQAAEEAAVAVRCRISTASEAASNRVSPEVQNQAKDTTTPASYSALSPKDESKKNSEPQSEEGFTTPDSTLHQVMARLEAAECDKAQLELIAKRHADVVQKLQERCQALEAQLADSQNNADVANASSFSKETSTGVQTSPVVENSAGQEQAVHTSGHCIVDTIFHSGATATDQGHHDELEDIARRLDAKLVECMQQLQAATGEIKESRGQAVAAQADVHARETELAECREALAVLSAERDDLLAQVANEQRYSSHSADALSAAMRSEREAAARDFDALRAELHSLSSLYQEVTSKLALAQRQREEAVHAAELAATRSAFHEQMLYAKEAEIEDAVAERRALIEEKRRLHAVNLQLQQSAEARACEVQVGSERASAAFQRRALAAEGREAVVLARLADFQTQAENLQSRLGAQQRHVEELEALLAEERALQCSRESPEPSCQNPPLRHDDLVLESNTLMERLAASEQRCSTLQKERDALRTEIDTLQACMMGDTSPDAHADLLAELAQLQSKLQDERLHREQTQHALQAVIEGAQGRMISTSDGNDGALRNAETAPAPNVDSQGEVESVVRRLQFIAGGLENLGEPRSGIVSLGLEKEERNDVPSLPLPRTR